MWSFLDDVLEIAVGVVAADVTMKVASKLSDACKRSVAKARETQAKETATA